MTTFIRHSTPAIEDEVSPHLPTIAMLCRLIEQRGVFCDEPLWLNEGSYAAAEAEMKHVIRERGFSEIARASIPQRNFLLLGIPVMVEGED